MKLISKKFFSIIFSILFLILIGQAINLDPSLTTPIEGSNNSAYKDSTFDIETSVTCQGSPGESCGTVEGELYYYLRDEPRVKSIQSGTTSFSTANTDVTISSVNLSRSILFFSNTITDQTPSGIIMRGELTTSTNIHFERISANGNQIVKWFVVEFENGVDVQRDTITQNANTDTTITEVNLSQSFSITSFENNGNTWGSDDFVRGILSSSTNLQTTASQNVNNQLDYQVINYPYANVQSGTVSLTGTGASDNLVSQVDINKSFILFSTQSSGNTFINNGAVRVEFTDNDTINFNRISSTGTITIDYYVVEFTTNEKTQSGTTSFGASDTNQIVSIDKVNLNKSIVIIPDGKSGSGSYSSNDNPGPGWFTVDFANNTAINLTRAVASGTADVSWFVIEFEGEAPAGTRPLSTTSSPLTTSSTQPQSCSIDHGESCTLTWNVNASGTIGSVEDILLVVRSNDTSKIYYNFTDNATINIVNDLIAPKWSSAIESPSDPATYSPSGFYQFNISWNDIESDVLNDTTDVDTVLIEHNFSGSFTNETMTKYGTVYEFNISPLAAGIYQWKSYANDSSGNYNSSNTYTYTVNKASTSLTLNSIPGFTVLNGTQTNVSCFASNSEVNISLFRNGSLIGNSIGGTVFEVQTLGIGFYNYTCSNPASQNYSSSSTFDILEVTDKQIPNCNLSFNPVSPITFSTAVNVSCDCSNPETSAELYRNSTDVTSEINSLVTLSAGNYLYSCETPETATYAAIDNQSTFTVNKAIPTLNITINETASNFTGNITFNANISCKIVTPLSGILNITQDGSTIINGSSPLSTIDSYNTNGTYEIACNYNGNQNYTSLTETLYIIAEDKTPPVVTLKSPTDGSAEITSFNIEFNVTATDNIGLSSCTLWTDINGTWAANETKTFTGTNDSDIWTLLDISNGNYNWNANCCDNANSTNCAFASSNNTFSVEVFPRITINSPIGTINDHTPLLNVTLDRTSDELWYNIDEGDNITICTSCSGEQTTFIVLEEGSSTINIYANDTIGNLGSNATLVSLDMNYIHEDSYDDNSSINTYNNVAINNGNITTGTSGGSPLNIALMCDTAACADASKDVPYYDNLTAAGHNVTRHAATSFSTSPYDVLVISESVNSGNTAWAFSENIGILTAEGSNWDEMGFGTSGTSNYAGDTDGNIQDNTHYITKPYSTGTITLATGTTGIGNILGWGTGITDLIVYDSATTNGWLLVAESGATLDDTSTAADRRVFFAGQIATEKNQDNWDIFLRAVDWAASNDENPVDGNFTIHAINTTTPVTTISNITWSESNTDANNKLTVQISANNGLNWTNATNGQSINESSLVSGSSLLYRVLFDTNGTLFPSINNISINWSNPPKITDQKQINISKRVYSSGIDVYTVNITIVNKLNQSEDIIVLDYVPSDFTPGAYDPIYDFTNSTGGSFPGTIYGWNLTVAGLSTNYISYSISGTGDYNLIRNFMIGVD